MNWIGYCLLGGIYVGILYIYFNIPDYKDIFENYCKTINEIRELEAKLESIQYKIEKIEKQLEKDKYGIKED